MPRLTTERPRYAHLGAMLKPVMAEIARATRRSMTQLDGHYAGILHVSTATVRGWRTGHSRPATDAAVSALARDAVRHAGVDRAWCAAFLGACAAPKDLGQRLLAELFPGALPASPPEEPGQTPPFLAPPLPPQAVVGRERALSKLAQTVLASASTSLTALRGLPGVGKTTLATALAHAPEIRSGFRDGILWAGLGRDPDIDDGLRRWANALELDLARYERLPNLTARVEAIHDRIGTRRMLLVVDDAWTSTAALTYRMGGPNCAHLLTTRYAGIAHDFASGNITTVEELTLPSGYRLFANVAPGVAKSEAAEARRIVSRVGGLPLAVSLAARTAWKMADQGATYPARDLLGLIEARSGLDAAQPYALLETTPSLRGAATVSLDAVIGLSFVVLSEAEQQTLIALSALPPKPETFSRAAALEVGDCAFEALTALVDAGLVEVAGAQRYAIHQTISDYAARHRRDDSAPRRVIAHYLQYVKDHARQYALLDAEMANIVHAIGLARERGMQAFRLFVNHLYRFFQARGQHARGLALAEEAYVFSKSSHDPAGVAWSAMNIGNYLRVYRSDFPGAERWLREASQLFREQQNPEQYADALLTLGITLQETGRLDEAEPLFREVFDIGEEITDDSFVAEGLNALGMVANRRGDNDGAISFYQQALQFAGRIEYPALLANILCNLGLRLARKGDLARARERFTETVRVARRGGLIQREFSALMDWAAVELDTGELSEAERLFDAALALAKTTRSARNLSDATRVLARLRLRQTRLGEARKLLEQSLTAAEEADLDNCRAETLFELAKLESQSGNREVALSHAGRSEAIWRKLARADRADEVAAWTTAH